MPNYSRTDTFLKQYKKLPDTVKEKFKKQILLFVEDPNHPSLKTKKNHSASNTFKAAVFESRIDKAYRFLWTWNGENYVLLLAIGDHEVVENKK
jgi:mRNA-degrading endonuclease RelE of RelBE toxin-antitoxin system